MQCFFYKYTSKKIFLISSAFRSILFVYFFACNLFLFYYRTFTFCVCVKLLLVFSDIKHNVTIVKPPSLVATVILSQ